MLKYHPYKSDKPEKKYYIITNSGRKFYFGAAGMSDFTHHKNEARKNLCINRHKKNKTGVNQVLTLPVSGRAGCCGISQPLKKVMMTLSGVFFKTTC